MTDLEVVLADLAAESAALEELVAPLPDDEWHRMTPAAGWTIAHQIGHLAWTDVAATAAARDRTTFDAIVTRALNSPDDFVDDAAETAAAGDPRVLLDGWRSGRAELLDALRAVAPGIRLLPWFGPPMSVVSMATARLMETWAHGQDVVDALGVAREPTSRLRHVAHIGVRTRNFAFVTHERPVPAARFRVELTGPGGDIWTWGPDDATQRVTGPALDFCLLVTQRRHRDDLAVVASGADADAWLDIAQAFAGPPGRGRERAS